MARTKQHTITVSLDVLPCCNHVDFVSTCIWCADAERVANETFRMILDLQRKTARERSKIIVTSGVHEKPELEKIKG